MNKIRALITGVAGSGGSYLADYVAESHPQIELHGLSRWHSRGINKNLAKSANKITFHECDLTDFSAVFKVLRTVKPDLIFHLASHANVLDSFVNPLSVLQNNIIGTANLLEAIKLSDVTTRVQLCSTSEVYGQVDPKYVPITEECPLNPSSPYAVSKTAQDLLGYTYFKSYNLPIIRTRMFTYINPRREDLFATSFSKQIARIEVGLQEELLHGNLSSTRTVIDVRDAVEAYWLAIERCLPGEVYNIGGTKIISVGEFLEVLKSLATCPIPSRVDAKLLRPADVTLQIPDVSKFKNQTGWQPRFSFEESVEYLLNHCRQEVREELSR